METVMEFKRVRIPAEDPEAVRERDGARLSARIGDARRPSERKAWDEDRAEYFGDNTAKVLEDIDGDD